MFKVHIERVSDATCGDNDYCETKLAATASEARMVTA